ncbi:FxsA family protein [Scopulibacillus cellulosilyticus]|uniref:FxsA family protein n=1 Tax=Scopulibacillus cellulosilyticus TaxID=2665665 RepID=A0ABW2PWZ8_9BACL
MMRGPRPLLFIFILVPAIEIFLFVLSGKYLGIPLTLLLIIATGITGAWLAKREGLQTLKEIRAELSAGRLPGQSLVEGACILAGGILLLTPGFFTDICGFLLLFPPIRKKAKDRVINWLRKRTANGRPSFYFRR